MEIKKAVITAAGKDQRNLPLQSLVDRDGTTKTALVILIEEILAAGIDRIGLVISGGGESAYAAAAGPHAGRITFITQSEPLGYAHAIHCAAEFTAQDPFLLLVGDHLYLSGNDRACAQQLVERARAENCSISAVQATHESKLPYYGAVGGHLINSAHRLYKIDSVLEKPTPTEAEQKLIVPGLRAGYYLCFFGMHVLTPAIHAILSDLFAKSPAGGIHFRQALAALVEQEKYLACELEGRRYDIGVEYGLFNAQLALALSGTDRDEVLSGLVELLATVPHPH